MMLEGRWDGALAALDAANARDRRASAAIRTERGRVLMDRSFFHRRDPAAARAALEEGRRLAKAAGDDATAAAADQGLGQLDYNDAFETKDWKKPRAAFESVLAVRERIGDRRGAAETLFYLGLTYEQDGQPGPAFDRYEKSLAISQDVEDLVQQSYARRHMAGIQEERESSPRRRRTSRRRSTCGAAAASPSGSRSPSSRRSTSWRRTAAIPTRRPGSSTRRSPSRKRAAAPARSSRRRPSSRVARRPRRFAPRVHAGRAGARGRAGLRRSLRDPRGAGASRRRGPPAPELSSSTPQASRLRRKVRRRPPASGGSRRSPLRTRRPDPGRASS